MPSETDARPVVVGVDGSAPSRHAVVWAAEEAARQHRSLRLVHAVMAPALAGLEGWPLPELSTVLDAAGRGILVEAQSTVREEHPELDVATTLPQCGPVQALLEESPAAHMLVLGPHGNGGFPGMLMGSTASALATHALCPITVVRTAQPGQSPPSTGPVVVGVDGYPASETALALAFAEASQRNTDLLAVHTWRDYMCEVAQALVHDVVETHHRLADEHTARLGERLAGWAADYPDVAVSRVVTRDSPVPRLLKHAHEAQLLVVGSRGRGGIQAMLLGSTSHTLLHHAPCPVLIARPHTMNDQYTRGRA